MLLLSIKLLCFKAVIPFWFLSRKCNFKSFHLSLNALPLQWIENYSILLACACSLRSVPATVEHGMLVIWKCICPLIPETCFVDCFVASVLPEAVVLKVQGGTVWTLPYHPINCPHPCALFKYIYHVSLIILGTEQWIIGLDTSYGSLFSMASPLYTVTHRNRMGFHSNHLNVEAVILTRGTQHTIFNISPIPVCIL